MKTLFIIMLLALVVCFTVNCQDKAAMEELAKFKAQAEVEEQNKALTLKMMETWGRGDFVAYKELLTTDALFYYPSNSAKPMSQDELIEFAEMYRKAMADISWSMEELISKEDKITFRFIESGTHSRKSIRARMGPC